jgi:hypothetical protein
MRDYAFAVFTLIGLGLTMTPSAPAQAIYANPYGYPLSTTDLYAVPPGGYGMRVYGPGTTFSYPYMYQSNNPYFAQRYSYTYTYHRMSPYGLYPVYGWSR